MARRIISFILSMLMFLVFALALKCVISNGEGIGVIISVAIPTVISLVLVITAFKQGRILVTLTLIITTLFVVTFSAFVLTTELITFEGIPEKDECTVIVLGAKTNGYIPSNRLVSRLDAAYDYLKVNTNALCIVTGGKGNDETVAEAESMRSYLVKDKKLSADRVYKEDKSVNTKENLVFAYEIIKSLEDEEKPIVIVTSRFHTLRAYLIAKSIDGYRNTTVGCIPAEDAFSIVYMPSNYAREYCALISFFAKSVYSSILGK